MATKYKMLERLQAATEDSRLWAAIEEVLDDWDEYQSLLWFRGNTERHERFQELERRFGIK